ncbi:ferrous iron transporter B [Ruminococcus sp. XPD3002]|uniref:ferrous iron transporter B n=1 Tax=Ruminococcus sp. XPD3002 TaxID=1452269 RepID=UPI00091B4F0F|nr:ferrous iron transport protein B [Ruminococcus flavefaciens]
MNTRIALLGQPNSGKSTVYNALTGSHQHVGNWPGKTVEKNEGSFSYDGVKYSLIDLPGSYGLTGNSDEEVITTDYVNSGKADLVCVLVDASQLERSMFMVSEFTALKKPAVLVLNMMDVAESQNKKIDAELLSKRLGIPVLAFTAADGKGYDKLKKLLADGLASPKMISSEPEFSREAGMMDKSKSKYKWIEKILNGVTKTASPVYKTAKFDRIALHPFWGKVISVLIILTAFMVAMMIWLPFAKTSMKIPAALGQPISDLLQGWHVNSWLTSVFSLILPNVVAFAISMASFVLGINIVFGFLEEIGFLARVAYQFDGMLSKLGLQGKAVCPLLMGFGCTIGGASGTRVMDNWGQRMLSMAVVWAVPCSAIWGVVPVISGMFFSPAGTMLVCLGILAYMVVMIVIVSKVFGAKLAPKASRTGMIMELPPYHKAHWGHILKEALLKAWDIFKRALSTVAIVSLIFWLLLYSSSGNIEDSVLYKVGTAIEPVTKFFGMGWQTFMAFLSSAFAKEATLGVLNSVFVGQNTVVDAAFNAKLGVGDNAALADVITQSISKAEALAFMFACTFNVPCVMALSTTYRESHSLKWTAKVALFYIGGALVLSCIIYHIASIFM